MKQQLRKIYDYFDLEGRFPDYCRDKIDALTLVDYLVSRGYKYINLRLRNDSYKASFTKNNKRVFAAQGDTEAEAITLAFLSYLASFDKPATLAKSSDFSSFGNERFGLKKNKKQNDA